MILKAPLHMGNITAVEEEALLDRKDTTQE
jgi:hypothetical protein